MKSDKKSSEKEQPEIEKIPFARYIDDVKHVVYAISLDEAEKLFNKIENN